MEKTKTEQTILRALKLLSTVMFLEFFDSHTGKINDKLCSRIANDLFRACKKDSSASAVCAHLKDQIKIFVARSFVSDQDKDFILKVLIGEKYGTNSVTDSFLRAIVHKVRMKKDYVARSYVEELANFSCNLAFTLNKDPNFLIGEVANIVRHFPDEVARYLLLDSIKRQEENSEVDHGNSGTT